MKKLILLSACFAGVLISCEKEDSHPAPPTDPVIVSIWPVSGEGSAIVTIEGRNFSSARTANTVKFNNIEAVVLEASPDELQVVAPAAAGDGKVTVTVRDKIAEGPVYTYVEAQQAYYVSTVAGSGNAGFKDGSFNEAEFDGPEGLAVDQDGNIIVADIGNDRIRKIVIGTGRVTTVAGDGAGGFANGPVAAARFKSPWKVATGPQGNIFVADRDNFMVRKIATDGTVSTLAGDGSAGFRDGPGTAAEFKQPLDVAVDGEGNVYVADNTGHRIRKITPDGTVTTLAGNGSRGFADGTGAAAEFSYPSGIAVDDQGNVIVADRLNNVIRKVTPGGEVATIAGNGSSGYRDGEALSAEFSEPYGVAVDSKGNIFVADLKNQMIRKISPDGMVSTVAGTSKGFADGPGAAAAFYSPTDVAVDAHDNIYVADKGNQRIRKIVAVK